MCFQPAGGVWQGVTDGASRAAGVSGEGMAHALPHPGANFRSTMSVRGLSSLLVPGLSRCKVC